MAKYKKSYKNSRRNNNAFDKEHDNNNNKVSYVDNMEHEIEALNSRIEAECPDSGYAPPLNQKVTFRSLPLSQNTIRGLEEGHHARKQHKQQQQKKNNNNSGGKKKNINKNNNNNTDKSFTTMTAIQNACIPHALAGRDVLGAARTGSGKTLAFLIPLLEILYRNRYSSTGGDNAVDSIPGAMVLSPTRELAVQIFHVLRSIGSYHNLSAGLLVGGKKEFHLEQMRVGSMNILIGTPGRILQHLEQTPDFDVGGLLMLVLDEADRILDMGFRDQMHRILDYLPPGIKDGGTRQTLLFSATQTKRVADLAKLSLYKPEYINVHDYHNDDDDDDDDDDDNIDGDSNNDNATKSSTTTTTTKKKTKNKSSPTPESLQQSMVVIPLQHKLDTIYSFLKSHLQKKSIIFFSSCSQVRHAHELFCSMSPGIPLLALHGKLKQERRTRVYFDYLNRPNAALFATDVAARGLDFPNVDWVVQADAPEDIEMYIHRVGRTARYKSGGRALLCLLPSEEKGMKTLLENGRIPIQKLGINPTKTVVVTQKACGLVASNANLNFVAKKAYKSYIRSVHLMPNKDIFQVTRLPFDEYASSLGLASTPSLRFMKELKRMDRDTLRGVKNVNRKLEKLKEQIKAEKLKKRLEKMGGDTAVVATATAATDGDEEGTRKLDKRKRDDDDEDDEDDILVLKQKHDWGNDKNGGDDNDDDDDEKEDLPSFDINEVSNSRKQKRIRIDASSSGQNKRITFNDDGEEEEDDVVELSANVHPNGQDVEDLSTANNEYLQRVKERLMATSEQDRKEEKDRIRDKHKKKKQKERDLLGENDDDAGEAVLCTVGEPTDDDDDDDDNERINNQTADSSDDDSGSSSAESGNESSSESESDDDNEDIEAAENLALSLINGKK